MNNGEQNGGTNFDIMGSKEIKMMPFGAGRRMCPGYALEILHLEYFVANFVWYFAWKVGNGDRWCWSVREAEIHNRNEESFAASCIT